MVSVEIEDIVKKVNVKYGDNNSTHVKSVLQSLSRKFQIASYHSIEANCIFSKMHMENTMLDIANGFLNTRGQFDKDFLAIEAHTNACAQTLHSLADILAHALCYGLNLNDKMKTEKLEEISINKIKKKLEISNHKELLSLVNNFTDSSEYSYLSAFVNTTKHRSLVPSGYVGDLTKDSYDYKIDKFMYRKAEYLERGFNSFLEDGFSRITEKVVEILNYLNKEIES